MNLKFLSFGTISFGTFGTISYRDRFQQYLAKPVPVGNGTDAGTDARGFTLIEVMVASVIFAILALALGSIFGSAFQLWRRISFEHVNERVAVAMAEMVERREEARRFSPAKLKGTEFSFIGLIHSKSGGREIGELQYWVDSDGKILRRERTYSEFVKEEGGKITELAESAESLEVQELYFNGLNGQFQTDPVLGKASKDILPTPDAVQLTLKYKTSDGKSHVLERLFRV